MKEFKLTPQQCQMVVLAAQPAAILFRRKGGCERKAIAPLVRRGLCAWRPVPHLPETGELWLTAEGWKLYHELPEDVVAAFKDLIQANSRPGP